MTNVRSQLDTLNKEQRAELVKRLHKAQNEICYVDRKIINLSVHETDIDHIIAVSRGGLDEEQNWGLTHLNCNRSKGARDLQLQRILNKFKEHIETHGNPAVEGSTRNFTVNEALDELYPDRQEVGAVIKNGAIQISFNLEGQPRTEEF